MKRLKQKLSKQKKSKQKGVVAIETALGLFAFLLMIFFWMEVSYMGFVSALMDYSVTEAARNAKASRSDDYSDVFRDAIQESDSLWGSFIDVEQISFSTHYYETVDALADETCDGEDALPFCNETPTAEDSPIAIYRVSYPYQPLFISLFIDPDKPMTISREVITIQEYERSAFNG
ncbi:TadE family protein [Endozoicomonas sp.]|uniref:TadE family protein n=1 Tax=Endozoicomonas sp. TaxID=1892382 RepID=UPI002885C800|nr:pilus assembly protein [Endozoicomonas sp.]